MIVKTKSVNVFNSKKDIKWTKEKNKSKEIATIHYLSDFYRENIYVKKPNKSHVTSVINRQTHNNPGVTLRIFFQIENHLADFLGYWFSFCQRFSFFCFALTRNVSPLSTKCVTTQHSGVFTVPGSLALENGI